MADKPEVLTTTQARGGVGTHIVRYVLIISTVLAVLALLWVFGAAPQATDSTIETPAASATPPQG